VSIFGPNAFDSDRHVGRVCGATVERRRGREPGQAKNLGGTVVALARADRECVESLTMAKATEEAYVVRAEWDDEAEVWVATSDEVPGLVTGADTLEELIQKLRVMVPEMLEANGVLSPDAAAQAVFTVIAQRTEHPRAVA
jgi:predicted RNase H-like HicB family nuclease